MGIGYFYSDEPLICIHLLLFDPVLALLPLFLLIDLANERVLDVLAKFEAGLTESDILADYAFIDRLRVLNLFELAFIAVVVVL